MKLFLVVVLFLGGFVSAQKSDLNRVLFAVGASSWTTRDREAYEAVLSEFFKKKSLSQFSKSADSDFLLSRLAFREASVFELTPDQRRKAGEVDRKKLSAFSAAEIDREMDYILKAAVMVEIKESQHKESGRFNSWYELLKRKYQVRMK